MVKFNKIGVLGDIHLPHEDTSALFKALKILKKEKPDCIVVNGDLLDFPGLSRYDQVPNFNKTGIKDELSMGRQFFYKLRQGHPDAKIYFICGNHEFRLRTYAIRRAPEFYDFVDLEVDLDLRGCKVEWINTKKGAAKWTDTYVDLNGIKIGHWDRVNQGAGMTVRNLMAKKGGSIVQSHIHRGAIIYFTDIDNVTRFGMEVPCLCKPPFYGNINDWQRGLGFLDTNDNGEIRPRVIVF